ncbi:hypothetical protein PZ938_03085 [Luteipulveratus sp. YIM 133132]|uniref:phage portal protein family protein n=1 Tax=Luteipulveratus flavus TaxID=3031728 RepID=UPI0023AE97BA|nr:hypothetical protein [Luteipulveratus sp. YIM 133132]MDE9364577.1 hypothetical protein [Luteipulveratus sp. YIM 133132]
MVDLAPPPAPAKATKPNTTEQGNAVVATLWGGIYDDREQTPELRWPLSIDVFDRMRRTEAQIRSVLRAVKMPILRSEWLIDPAGADQRVIDNVRANLGLQVKGQDPVARGRTRGRFSWGEHLRHALLYLDFGHMFFEQVYRMTGDAAAPYELRKLGPRLPRSLDQIKVASDGGLVSITQHPLDAPGAAARPIPVSALVGYVHEREGGDWLGTSLLRPAYKNWFIKEILLRVQTQTIERNGLGVPRYTGAEREVDLAAGRKLAGEWRAGDNSGAAIPYGSKLDLVGVTGELPDADKPIRYHDEQMARAVLAHFLNLGTETGSWALGSTFADFFTLSLQAVADEIADIATQHIVEDLVDLNFGTAEPAPRIVCSPIGSKRDVTADAIKTLVDAGVLTNDEDIEQFVRSVYGLPARRPTPDPADNATDPAGDAP